MCKANVGHETGALLGDVLAALRRSRTSILSVAVVHMLAVIVGIVLVHAGNEFALSYGDGLVASARASDPAAIALQRGDRVEAAFLDFGRNLFLGAVPLTTLGLAVVTCYPIAVHRGWVGGIVSVDRRHTSRLTDAKGSDLLPPYACPPTDSLHSGGKSWRQHRMGLFPPAAVLPWRQVAWLP